MAEKTVRVVNGKIDESVLPASVYTRSNHTGTQTASTISDFTESAQDAAASLFTTGTSTGISFTYDDTNNKINATVTGGSGGSGDSRGAAIFKVGDRVAFDGTTNIRAGFEDALDAAIAFAAAGGNAILEMPAGVGPITTATSRTMPYLGTSTTSRYNSACGFGLPVNLSGHLTIRGQGRYATTIKLSTNCRALFWIDKKNDYDTFQNVSFEDFAVDNNGTIGQNHIICGTVPSSNTPQRRLSLYNLNHRRLRVFGVPRDEEWDPTANSNNGQYTMPTTKKAAFTYHSKHNNDYEAGTTPGQLPLTPYPGRNAAHGAKWTYTIGLTFEDIHVVDAQRAILVVSDITQNSSIWYDDIVIRRCWHEQSTPWPAWAPQTSFYIGGNCQGGRAEVTDCTSINIGDDGIEFGGMQELYVNNFKAVNPYLDGILVRYSQPPFNPNGVKIIVNGFTQIITPEALNNDTITRSDNTTARRAFRGRPFEIKVENDGALANLGQVILRNCKSIVEGGYHDTFNRSGLIGWNSSGPVNQTIIENCVVALRNLVLDKTTGETIAELFTVRGATVETGVTVSTVIRNAYVVTENITSSGGKYELHGFTPSGDGEIIVDGFTWEMRNCPSSSVVRTALVTAGFKPGAYAAGANRTLNRLILRNFKTSLLGTNTTVRRGLLVRGDEPVDYVSYDLCDFRAWALTADVDKGSAGTNGAKILDGLNNSYQLVPEQGRRNPISANYTIRSYDSSIAVINTSANRTLTLPAVASMPPGRFFTIIDESNGAGVAAANNIIIAAASGETFLGGANTYTLNVSGGSVKIYSNGTIWIVVK